MVSISPLFFNSSYPFIYIIPLIGAGEYLAGSLISYHNIHFYLEMVRGARAAIFDSKFDDFYQNFYNNYSSNRWE
jgi:queuine tRNA-ribosyltransferase